MPGKQNGMIDIICVGTLGAVAILALVSATVLAIIDTQVPAGFANMGSAAVGALAAFAFSRSKITVESRPTGEGRTQTTTEVR